ncbi:hypothetical protein E2562_018551 [Oryza meyeriana var. granulata]|uniref:Uncharacterized protein n=1 Tax=Oryza meyeriana var. granulata TaxID=110450 RepID=A0A6G1F9C4_9ORYZ|nr:hypothetical protein E2562_018551 [Oryza meyeriana var. granulata]
MAAVETALGPWLEEQCANRRRLSGAVHVPSPATTASPLFFGANRGWIRCRSKPFLPQGKGKRALQPPPVMAVLLAPSGGPKLGAARIEAAGTGGARDYADQCGEGRWRSGQRGSKLLLFRPLPEVQNPTYKSLAYVMHFL